MLSVISLLSSETPNLDSPANVDAAKEVRTDFAGLYQRPPFILFLALTSSISAYKKKVRRLVRRSAEEAFE
jgi:ubiquitin-conjugating enzyme E2 G1